MLTYGATTKTMTPATRAEVKNVYQYVKMIYQIIINTPTIGYGDKELIIIPEQDGYYLKMVKRL